MREKFLAINVVIFKGNVYMVTKFIENFLNYDTALPHLRNRVEFVSVTFMAIIISYKIRNRINKFLIITVLRVQVP